jgi:hypothetical protein
MRVFKFVGVTKNESADGVHWYTVIGYFCVAVSRGPNTGLLPSVVVPGITRFVLAVTIVL